MFKKSGQVGFHAHTMRRAAKLDRWMKLAAKKGLEHFFPQYTTGLGSEGIPPFKFQLLKKSELTTKEKNQRNRAKRIRKRGNS